MVLAGEHRVKEAARTGKQLEDIRHRWDALKKAAPQVVHPPTAVLLTV